MPKSPVSRSLILCLALVLAAAQAAGAAEPVLRVTAWAVNMSNVGTGTSSAVDIELHSWTTDATRDALLETFTTQGADALLAKLQKVDAVGTIRVPGALAYDLHFARQAALPGGGRRFLIATDRRIAFWEARERSRTLDYPFTLIEIHVDKNGKGEGKMSVATKITRNAKDGVIELENYASQPVRLMNVKVE